MIRTQQTGGLQQLITNVVVSLDKKTKVNKNPKGWGKGFLGARRILLKWFENDSQLMFLTIESHDGIK